MIKPVETIKQLKYKIVLFKIIVLFIPIRPASQTHLIVISKIEIKLPESL